MQLRKVKRLLFLWQHGKTEQEQHEFDGLLHKLQGTLICEETVAHMEARVTELRGTLSQARAQGWKKWVHQMWATQPRRVYAWLKKRPPGPGARP